VNFELVETLSRQLHKEVVDQKLASGYHSPVNCTSRFGCEKCRHDVGSWDALSLEGREKVQEIVISVLLSLENMGYKVVPGLVYH